MKIAVISDPHLGCDAGGDREDDCYEHFDESIERAIAEKVDLILIPGDLFDVRMPKQEVFAKAFKIFQKPLLAQKNGIKLERFTSEHDEVSPMAMQGIPVVAIYGNHDRRGEHLVNPVQVLEKAGYIVYVELNTVVFDNHGDKLAITGFGGIADGDVRKTLESWKPKPVEGAFNIFMFHQSLKEAVYDVNDEFISVNELPKGFDFYLNGHIHQWQWMEDKKLLIAGSTALTQQKENETDGKCFFIIETNPFKLTPMKIDNQRPFFFKKFDFESATQENVSNAIRDYLKSLPRSEKKTLVKVKLAGKMELGRRSNQLDLTEFREPDGFILSIDNELESDEFKKLVAELRELHQSKKSVDEMGMDLIKQLLAQTNYKGMDLNEIIEPLADGDNDFVMQKILSKAEKNQS